MPGWPRLGKRCSLRGGKRRRGRRPSSASGGVGALMAAHHLAFVRDALGLALTLRTQRDEARLDAADWEGRHDFLLGRIEAEVAEQVEAARDSVVEDIRQANLAYQEAQALSEALQEQLQQADVAKLRGRLRRKTAEIKALKRSLAEARAVAGELARRVAGFERLHRHDTEKEETA